MAWTEARKIRGEETWEDVRRAWEAGETGASVARRFDVGLANVWRRRASEGWERNRPKDPVPEPLEGWDNHARRKQKEFEQALSDARRLAVTLARAMAGGALEDVPLWPAGFVMRWREEHLGPETAARDRAWVEGRQAWAAAFWDKDGRLERQSWLDAVTMRANREAWREDVGLPPGKAESWP